MMPTSNALDDVDVAFMREALIDAEVALREWEVPCACVLVNERTNEVAARGRNATNATRCGTRHAEMVCIDAALRAFGNDVEKFSECVMYVTCEPCVMCASALRQCGVKRVVFGCANDTFGGCGTVVDCASANTGGCGVDRERVGTYDVRGGVFASEAVGLLREFYVRGNPKAPTPHRTLTPEANARRSASANDVATRA